MNRVYQVYKGLQDAGREMLLPPPPLAHDPDHPDSNLIRHDGVIDRPDPHKVEDRVRLLAAIEMDDQLNQLRQKQIEDQKKQVLPKPNINNNAVQLDPKIDKASSSEIVPAQVNIKDDLDVTDDKPMVQGGQDKNIQAQKRRDTVKAVS